MFIESRSERNESRGESATGWGGDSSASAKLLVLSDDELPVELTLSGKL